MKEQIEGIKKEEEAQFEKQVIMKVELPRVQSATRQHKIFWLWGLWRGEQEGGPGGGEGGASVWREGEGEGHGRREGLGWREGEEGEGRGGGWVVEEEGQRA